MDIEYSLTRLFDGKSSTILSFHSNSSSEIFISALLLSTQTLICRFITPQWIQIVKFDVREVKVKRVIVFSVPPSLAMITTENQIQWISLSSLLEDLGLFDLSIESYCERRLKIHSHPISYVESRPNVYPASVLINSKLTESYLNPSSPIMKVVEWSFLANKNSFLIFGLKNGTLLFSPHPKMELGSSSPVTIPFPSKISSIQLSTLKSPNNNTTIQALFIFPPFYKPSNKTTNTMKKERRRQKKKKRDSLSSSSSGFRFPSPNEGKYEFFMIVLEVQTSTTSTHNHLYSLFPPIHRFLNSTSQSNVFSNSFDPTSLISSRSFLYSDWEGVLDEKQLTPIFHFSIPHPGELRHKFQVFSPSLSLKRQVKLEKILGWRFQGEEMGGLGDEQIFGFMKTEMENETTETNQENDDQDSVNQDEVINFSLFNDGIVYNISFSIPTQIQKEVVKEEQQKENEEEEEQKIDVEVSVPIYQGDLVQLNEFEGLNRLIVTYHFLMLFVGSDLDDQSVEIFSLVSGRHIQSFKVALDNSFFQIFSHGGICHQDQDIRSMFSIPIGCDIQLSSTQIISFHEKLFLTKKSLPIYTPYQLFFKGFVSLASYISIHSFQGNRAKYNLSKFIYHGYSFFHKSWIEHSKQNSQSLELDFFQSHFDDVMVNEDEFSMLLELVQVIQGYFTTPIEYEASDESKDEVEMKSVSSSSSILHSDAVDYPNDRVETGSVVSDTSSIHSSMLSLTSSSLSTERSTSKRVKKDIKIGNMIASFLFFSWFYHDYGSNNKDSFKGSEKMLDSPDFQNLPISLRRLTRFLISDSSIYDPHFVYPLILSSQSNLSLSDNWIDCSNLSICLFVSISNCNLDIFLKYYPLSPIPLQSHHFQRLISLFDNHSDSSGKLTNQLYDLFLNIIPLLSSVKEMLVIGCHSRLFFHEVIPFLTPHINNLISNEDLLQILDHIISDRTQMKHLQLEEEEGKQQSHPQLNLESITQIEYQLLIHCLLQLQQQQMKLVSSSSFFDSWMYLPSIQTFMQFNWISNMFLEQSSNNMLDINIQAIEEFRFKPIFQLINIILTKNAIDDNWFENILIIQHVLNNFLSPQENNNENIIQDHEVLSDYFDASKIHTEEETASSFVSQQFSTPKQGTARMDMGQMIQYDPTTIMSLLHSYGNYEGIGKVLEYVSTSLPTLKGGMRKLPKIEGIRFKIQTCTKIGNGMNISWIEIELLRILFFEIFSFQKLQADMSTKETGICTLSKIPHSNIPIQNDVCEMVQIFFFGWLRADCSLETIHTILDNATHVLLNRNDDNICTSEHLNLFLEDNREESLKLLIHFSNVILSQNYLSKVPSLVIIRDSIPTPTMIKLLKIVNINKK